MRGSRGENDKYKGFLFNTGQDPLKNHTYFKPAFNVLCWAIIGPPAKRHLHGVSLAGRQWLAFNGICILSPSKKERKKHWQSWTPSDKTFLIRACENISVTYTFQRNVSRKATELIKMCCSLDKPTENMKNKRGPYWVVSHFLLQIHE